jgi:hypothetical protein
MSRRAIAILLAAAAIQVALATIPDTMGDLLEYRSWTRTLARQGLTAAYWPPAAPIDSPAFSPPIDYPPLLPYAFWVLGRALRALSPTNLDGNTWLLDLLIRLPFVLSNLLLALLVYVETRRYAPSWAHMAFALVALNPALIFDTAYWGQADAPCALLVTASIVALVRGWPEWSWAALAAAALVKPLAYPLAPLIAVETLRRFGPGRTARAAAAALVVAGVAFAPFALRGHLLDALRDLVTQVDAMPYISVNAHNLWWLLGLGAPWTNAYASPLGLVSWNTLSLLLFGSFYLAVLALLWRSREPRSLYVASATTVFGFFVLSTHMHENHLFYAVPLLALAAAESRPARTALGILTVAMLANMALHDPFLTYWARPHTPGPHLLLPARLDPQLELRDRLAHLGYPWIVNQMRGETTLLGSLATLLNAETVVLTFVAWLALVWRPHGFDAARCAASWSIPRHFWILALAFVVATGVPFLDHVLRYQREHYFLLHLDEARVHTADPARVGIYTFDIGGDRRKVLWVHPPSEVTYAFTPPTGTVLHTALALRPATWSRDKGDGVRFEIRVDEAGRRQTLLSRYMDPKRNPADRRWEPVSVDLSPFEGHPILLTFATTGGPAGNIDFDWAGFSDPTLETR